jgi:putative colanic acid biosynthesis acetyltransferase WcaF
MAKQAHYNAADHIDASTAADPYNRPAFSLKNRLQRLVWGIVWLLLFRISPRPLFAWRAALLKLFGAKLGPGCKFYPSATVHSPWNLTCEDLVAVADGVEIYNPAPLHIGSHAILSQGCYLCGATHDFDDPAFPLLAYAMQLGPYSWVCARACVAPGVNLGEGAILGLASVATRSLEPWAVYAGAPAVRVRDRKRPA